MLYVIAWKIIGMTLILFLPLPNKQIKYLYVMKKILFFMILLCPIVLGGCSSDDDACKLAVEYS